jgi:DNA-binding transcriptional LysR family regulator
VFMQRAAKTITALPVKLEHPERELGLLWHINRPMRPAVRRFQKFLEAEFAGLAQRIDERGRENVWRR